MPETATETGTSTESTTTETTTEGTGTTTGEQLGEAGQRALAAERAARQDADRARKALEKELADLRTQSMTDAEKAVAKAKEEGRTEALAAANERLLKAEVRAVAAGKLADPSDAIRFLDLGDFKVDDDGNVDTKVIGKAIDHLLKEKPYLAPGKTGKPSGSGDGGPRGGSGQPTMNDIIRDRMRR